MPLLFPSEIILCDDAARILTFTAISFISPTALFFCPEGLLKVLPDFPLAFH